MKRTLAFLVLAFVQIATVLAEKEKKVVDDPKKIKKIEKTLGKIEKLLAKAKESNSVAQANCYLQKRNLVFGLFKASVRASEGKKLSKERKDETSQLVYLNKIDAYANSCSEIEASLNECSLEDNKNQGDMQTLVYIIREDEAEDSTKNLYSAWDWNNLSGSEPFPVVPPASPFR